MGSANTIPFLDFAIALFIGALVKCGMVAALGAPALRRPILVSTAAVLGAGALLHFVAL